MKLKEKISIDKFDGKRFQIRLIEAVSPNHKKAIVTHYLHNKDNGAAKYYKNNIKKYIPDGFENLGVPLTCWAFYFNLFVRSSLKVFSIQFLTQIKTA